MKTEVANRGERRAVRVPSQSRRRRRRSAGLGWAGLLGSVSLFSYLLPQVLSSLARLLFRTASRSVPVLLSASATVRLSALALSHSRTSPVATRVSMLARLPLVSHSPVSTYIVIAVIDLYTTSSVFSFVRSFVRWLVYVYGYLDTYVYSYHTTRVSSLESR